MVEVNEACRAVVTTNAHPCVKLRPPAPQIVDNIDTTKQRHLRYRIFQPVPLTLLVAIYCVNPSLRSNSSEPITSHDVINNCPSAQTTDVTFRLSAALLQPRTLSL
jgi:hypothetical protein